MSLVAPGIAHLSTSKTSNTFLVDGDDGLTLVDAGTTNGIGVLLRSVTDTGFAPSDIKRIVLTHAHPDHVQAAPQLRERTGAHVLIHHGDAAWLTLGRVPSEGRSGMGGRNYDRIPAAAWTPFQADGTVEDADLIEGSGGLRVIHTPGHSPGHIALLHEPTRTLLVGDAVFHNKQLGLGPATFAADPTAQAASLARIPTDIAAVGFGHGNPILEADVGDFHAFLDKAKHRRLS
jgi:glyoxylase-like metal-dependent hydrolase (beta-lactamase superfamily II)